jgi:hypothetical protein
VADRPIRNGERVTERARPTLAIVSALEALEAGDQEAGLA